MARPLREGVGVKGRPLRKKELFLELGSSIAILSEGGGGVRH